MEEARKEFQFDGPGSFTLNLKSTLSVEENVDYIEVETVSFVSQQKTKCIE